MSPKPPEGYMLISEGKTSPDQKDLWWKPLMEDASESKQGRLSRTKGKWVPADHANLVQHLRAVARPSR